MTLNIGLSDQERKGGIDMLNVLLADEYVLYTTTRNYHWNVVGPQSMIYINSSNRNMMSWTTWWMQWLSASAP